ncbi:MAG: site-specific DNA-methyltransferase [Candidatus Tectomicrobia bacterium]|uniref:Methyltransferase n=1 Tax=Tectimicrobiota bacterium TaxID=2528274 RepID=A0A933LQ18_UNCTE|nr:site-specific DNA-methyltransferase [Candidatus Tectomicrobia bacterium]
MPKKDIKVNAALPKPKGVRKKTKTSTDVVREVSPSAYDVKQNAIDCKLLTGTTRKLQILGARTCDCPPNHLNCLTAKEWMKSQIGVWQFNYERRDIRNKELHPATFPISLARKVVELFTHQGELVIDPFVGSGTTLVAANDCNRNAAGFDLKEDYVNLSNSRIPKFALQESRQEAICDDARNIPLYLERDSVSLIFTSPPYANLLNRKRLNKSRRADLRKNSQYLKVEQYSQDERDLGILSLEAYSNEMGKIFKQLLPLLRPNAHCVINVPDMWWQDQRITIHIALVDSLRKVGYELRNTIIWDRTNIVNRIGIFGWPRNYITMGTTFEYLLDFIKPPEIPTTNGY